MCYLYLQMYNTYIFEVYILVDNVLALKSQQTGNRI